MFLYLLQFDEDQYYMYRYFASTQQKLLVSGQSETQNGLLSFWEYLKYWKFAPSKSRYDTFQA